MTLKKHERQALEFLSKGPDTIGVIDSDEKAAAGCVFLDLKNKGWATAVIGDNGPTYSITKAGLRALASH